MPVQVILKEKRSKKPVQFVNVKLYNRERVFIDDTNSRGKAILKGVPDGTYILEVKTAKYRPHHEEIFVSTNSIINVKLESGIVYT